MTAPSDALASFHPAVKAWFERRFPGGATEPQAQGWPAIARGHDTLIAAPTGTGKTLAAFLVCIDRLYREYQGAGVLDDETHLVYVSPLKALGVDIQKNLRVPLDEIREVAGELGLAAPDVRALVRSGDTTSSERAAMLRRPPHLLITTPESLYLMVTAEKSRERLRRVHTVIVDEIHAVARDKRGSHLALTLERLDALCDTCPTRIGLSATQKPIETIARLLVGSGPEHDAADGSPRCAVVDVGHRRALDLHLWVSGSELEAVISAEQWGEILDDVAEQAARHRTTLVFVNTRRLAERLAHLLEERLGEERVAAHHGSLSKEKRLAVEERLRAGKLSAVVATASLELGIDVGPVELVCQIGSPRSIATFLQRVGRSGHHLGGTPKGRLYPTSRDELVECAALLRAVGEGHLDRVLPPQAPLDILAQQIVAACGAGEWQEDELFALVRGAAPYAELPRERFDSVVEMLSDGIQTGRGRRAAHLHRDRIHGVLRGRRGARLAALTSGGAIPDTADYRVVADPDDTFVGTVNEDWAIESMAGDIFLLGSTSWQIRRVEKGVVRVRDAGGLPPTIPFWLGEAPARTNELSQEVSRLRAEADSQLADGGRERLVEWLVREVGLAREAAEQVAHYLAAGRAALGVLPTQRDVVLERFFDETGGMQLVIHAPFGGRVNRALGLSVRKRVCRSFNFELQAAANDDAIVLSLGPQHSFPLADAPKMLMSPKGLRETLSQAVLPAPMFTARWRWNLGRSLAILRMRGGSKNPAPIQRMEADDLMAAIFPTLAACQEHQTGPIEIPDHPVVNQTLDDCLHEAMDVDGLGALFSDIEGGRVRVHARETTEPSPLSHEILNGRPFTFLDDAPLEERRTRAVALRRGLPEDGRDLARLDSDAIERVRSEARPDPRDAEELHDLLLSQLLRRPEPAWGDFFDALAGFGRAAVVETERGPRWLAAESAPAVQALFPDAKIVPEVRLPDALVARAVSDTEQAVLAAVRGHLEVSGPTDVASLAADTALRPIHVEQALARLEGEGFLLRGRFDPAREEEQVCARRLLARIHLQTQERLRKEIEPVSAQDFVRFLLRWQHVVPETRREARRGVLAVVEQLQGFELAAGAWEEAVLPARVQGYRPAWLDDLCLSGDVVWGRLGLRAPAVDDGEALAVPRGATPSRATPITLAVRDDFDWLLDSVRGDARPAEPEAGQARLVLETLRERGALFFSELAATVGGLPVEVEQGLWELVSRGLVAADGFQSVRALLGARQRPGRARPSERRRRLRRGARGGVAREGRWALLPASAAERDADALAEAVAEQLLARWGVLFRDLMVRESVALPWRELLWALRRLEARGAIRGGRFVTGFVGEQYALPGAVEAMRRTRRMPRRGELVRLSAADPLNLVGVLTPGGRVPALRSREVAYRDGEPVPVEVDQARRVMR